jgi:hypothetical protein
MTQNYKTTYNGGTSPDPAERWEGNYAPVVLFVFNRPHHVTQTVEALQKDWLAPQSDLYIFSDGAKEGHSAALVEAVRKYIRNIRGFRSVVIIERDRNLGLADSIITGVNQICEEFGRVIVLEDDLLISPDFLTFMNSALEQYVHEPRVFSISGFNFGLRTRQSQAFDAFCFYRSSSLGWGTWSSRWNKCDWDVSDYDVFRSDAKQREAFNRGGEDLARMLDLQMNKRLDSWAIRWAYAHFKHDAFALLSLQPRVFHIGADSSATNTKRKGALSQAQLTCDLQSTFRFPQGQDLQPRFVTELRTLFRPSPARKAVRIVRDVLWQTGLAYRNTH